MQSVFVAGPKAAPQPQLQGSRRPLAIVCSAVPSQSSRRAALQGAAGVLGGILLAKAAPALAIDDERKMLCEDACAQDLAGKERVTTASGLQYQDIVVGTGSSPIVGFQVVCNYVAMTPQGKVFDSSLERRTPYEFRYGVGSVIPGLDEGLKSMKVGGLRRLYIPGELAFPKGVPAAAGRARVPPSSPVVFDVQLLYIPGLDDE